MPSVIKLLQVELMALIEYASRNHNKVSVDMEMLRSAITSIALSQVNSAFVYAKQKAKNAEDNKSAAKNRHVVTPEEVQAKIDRINANSANNKVWEPIEDKIQDAIGGVQSAMANLYTSFGSSVALLSRDGQLGKTTERNYGTSETINGGVAYFVPIKWILSQRTNGVSYKDRVESGKISLDTAITEVLGKKYFLCNYDINQPVDKAGYKYINGGTDGLHVLAGTIRQAGILPTIDPVFKDISWKSIDQRPNPKPGETKFRIRLTPEQADVFTKMITDADSYLRREVLQLTSESNMKTGSDHVENTGEPDDPNSAQNGLEGKQSEGQKNLASGRDEKAYENELAAMNRSVQTKVNVVQNYISNAHPLKPKITVDPPESSGDLFVDTINKIQYLSDFAVKFGKHFKVDVPCNVYNIEQQPYRIANYTKDIRTKVSNAIAASSDFVYDEALKKMVAATNNALYSELNDVEGRIASVYDNFKLNNNNQSETNPDEVKRIRELWKTAVNTPHKTSAGITTKVDSIVDELSELASSDDAWSGTNAVGTIPAELKKLYDQYCAIDRRISTASNLPTVDEVQQAIVNIVRPIAVYGTRHIDNVARYKKLCDDAKKLAETASNGVQLRKLASALAHIMRTYGDEAEPIYKNLKNAMAPYIKKPAEPVSEQPAKPTVEENPSTEQETKPAAETPKPTSEPVTTPVDTDEDDDDDEDEETLRRCRRYGVF